MLMIKVRTTTMTTRVTTTITTTTTKTLASTVFNLYGWHFLGSSLEGSRVMTITVIRVTTAKLMWQQELQQWQQEWQQWQKEGQQLQLLGN